MSVRVRPDNLDFLGLFVIVSTSGKAKLWSQQRAKEWAYQDAKHHEVKDSASIFPALLSELY